MTAIINITPFFRVTRLDQSLKFYCETLGFACWAKMPGYAYVSLGRAGIRLAEQGEDEPLTCSMAYIDLDDVDAFFDATRPKLENLPAGSVERPKDQDYPQREFTIADLDGNQLVFGQGIGPNAEQWAGWPRY